MTRSKATCPICGKDTLPQLRPFCSKRCQQIDLGRWLSGSYAIPSQEEDLEDRFEAPTDPPGPGRPN